MQFRRTVWLMILIAVVVGGAVTVGIASSLLSKGECVEHSVVIRDDKVSPQATTGKVCDTMKITNDDDVTRLMAFGVHDHHQAYDGVTDRILHKGESMTVTFDQVGSFHFHDHLHDEVEGYFTVKR